VKAGGASGSQLHTPPLDSLAVGVVFPREMRYVWTRLRVRTNGLEVRSDVWWCKGRNWGLPLLSWTLIRSLFDLILFLHWFLLAQLAPLIR
jgi:hypothetical protein